MHSTWSDGSQTLVQIVEAGIALGYSFCGVTDHSYGLPIAGGVSTLNIVRRHIIPNTLGPVVVYVTLTVPSVILTESFVSFLGLGVQEPDTSWGVLISDGARNMETAWWALVFPGIFLAVTLFCFNFIGDGLRDALDPKDR